MVYLELFLSFVKIGFTSFGGMSMVPLILQEMENHQWMSSADLTNLIAIAEMTPGPLGLNCATFAGTRTAGFLGGLTAVAGVLTPAFTLTLAAAIFFQRFKTSPVMAGILRVIKPVCMAMIFSVLLSLVWENYFPDRRVDFLAIAIGALSFYLLRKRRWSVPLVILCAGILGVLGYGVVLPALQLT